MFRICLYILACMKTRISPLGSFYITTVNSNENLTFFSFYMDVSVQSFSEKNECQVGLIQIFLY